MVKRALMFLHIERSEKKNRHFWSNKEEEREKKMKEREIVLWLQH
jgi:hypothetical protein